MALARSRTLFYSPDLSNLQLQRIFLGLQEPPAETIDFTDEAGGQAERQLAIPLLTNMDAIRVQQAEIRFVVAPRETEIHSHQVVDNSGGGVFLSLPSPGLLKKVLVEYTAPTPTPGKTMRLILRSAAKQGSGFSAGPPLFANPGLPPVGDMYQPALPEFGLSSQAGNRRLITLSGLMGSAWLIQLAEGDKPEELSPLSTAIKVVSVTLDSVPKDLAVFLKSASGDIPLWSSPGLLLPAQNEQVVSITPIAQKHLAEKLKSAGASDAALPVSLKFQSAAAGTLQLRSKNLHGVYVAQPLGADAFKTDLPGDRIDVSFDVPAGRTPQANSAQLTVRITGKRRAAASSESPHSFPVHGLQVNQTMYAAAGVAVSVADTNITAVRLFVGIHEKTETVLVVCADAGGAPGEPVGKPAVQTFDLKKAGQPNGKPEQNMQAGVPQWIVFNLPAAFTAETPKLWLTLRANVGSLLWFTDPAADGLPLVSLDQGKTWGAPETPLNDAQKLLAQLWIDTGAPAPSGPLPVVRLERDGTVLNSNLLAGAQRGSRGEFKASMSFPQSELTAPAAGGKAGKRFQLVSSAVAGVVLEGFELTFDPEASGA